VATTIASVAPAVLARRIRSVLALDDARRFAQCTVPTLYLRGRDDRLVPDSSWRSMSRLRPLTIAEIPGPRLQTEPAQDLAALRRLEEQRLSSYGWIDRQQKTVHIPIDRAIAATVERGLTGWREK